MKVKLIGMLHLWNITKIIFIYYYFDQNVKMAATVRISVKGPNAEIFKFLL